ncbi:hypothetical protein LEMLEM_LOCUS6582 [Lemmus lemmus]
MLAFNLSPGEVYKMEEDSSQTQSHSHSEIPEGRIYILD